MPTQTKEHYLKALYFLDQKEGKISVTELARELEVSPPTVNDMVKKLVERGWVEHEKYKPLKLTDKGRKTAALIIRKHRLSEMFLVRIMQFGWEEVHAIAEDLEHVHSAAFFDRMDDLLGQPAVDPHGSPIPDKEGRVTRTNHPALTEVDPGQKTYLRALGDSSATLLKYLNARRIKLGTELVVVRVEAFDGSLEVQCDGRREVISAMVGERLLVEVA